jgi:hypothetical protein
VPDCISSAAAAGNDLHLLDFTSVMADQRENGVHRATASKYLQENIAHKCKF